MEHRLPHCTLTPSGGVEGSAAAAAQVSISKGQMANAPVVQSLATLLKVLATQPCPTLCSPMDYSPPGSSVHGVLQARILQWLPFPSPGGLPDPGIEPRSSALQADSLPPEPPGEPSNVPGKRQFVVGMQVPVCGNITKDLPV